MLIKRKNRKSKSASLIKKILKRKIKLENEKSPRGFMLQRSSRQFFIDYGENRRVHYNERKKEKKDRCNVDSSFKEKTRGEKKVSMAEIFDAKITNEIN